MITVQLLWALGFKRNHDFESRLSGSVVFSREWKGAEIDVYIDVILASDIVVHVGINGTQFAISESKLIEVCAHIGQYGYYSMSLPAICKS